MPDYSQGKIYKITNEVNDEIYIGSTCLKLTERFRGHKKSIKKYINFPFYKCINEIGIEKFKIELIENFPCNNNKELEQKEGEYIRQLGTLNKHIEGRTRKERNKNYRQNFRQNNKEKCKEYDKKKYENNKEKILEKRKIYYKNNKEKIEERKKEKVICECGCEVKKCNLKKHQKSKRHLNLIN